MSTTNHKILLAALTGVGAIACAAPTPSSSDTMSGAEEGEPTTTTTTTPSTGGTAPTGSTGGSTGGPTETSSGGTGGTTSTATGGSTPVSTGGSTSTPVPSSCVDANGTAPLIDDLNDNDKNLALGDGRNGKWAVAADSAGSLSESAGEVAPESGEYCLEASGHNEWGANLSAYLVEPRGCYDASSYSGVCFTARGEVETPSVDDDGMITGTTDGTVVFSVTKNSTEYDNCAGTCDSAHSVDIANADLNPTTAQEFCFDWADLQAEGSGLSDVSDLWRLEWKLPAWSWKGVDASVDGFICIDEVRFK